MWSVREYNHRNITHRLAAAVAAPKQQHWQHGQHWPHWKHWRQPQQKTIRADRTAAQCVTRCTAAGRPTNRWVPGRAIYYTPVSVLELVDGPVGDSTTGPRPPRLGGAVRASKEERLTEGRMGGWLNFSSFPSDRHHSHCHQQQRHQHHQQRCSCCRVTSFFACPHTYPWLAPWWLRPGGADGGQGGGAGLGASGGTGRRTGPGSV